MATLSWLARRLAQEDIAENPERWKAIISRLDGLSGVDESTTDGAHEDSIQTRAAENRAASDRGLQPLAGACKQDQSRGGPSANTSQNASRGDVGSLREAFPESQVMNPGELRVISIASALITRSCALTIGERKLARAAKPIEGRALSEYRDRIADGEDVLGTEFCKLRAPEQRRQTGATYTPPAIVKAMISWAERAGPPPDCVVDPGIGSGRFMTAAAKTFPTAQLVGVDIDPLALLMARANACVLGYSHRLRLEFADYREAKLPVRRGRTLFIGNPPYVRHHQITEDWKNWFAATARRYGFNASKLAGLHIHFFLRTREIANQGDYGTFITSSEWLDVNYGSALRRMLADGLGGSAVHIIDAKAMPFTDAFTTGAVTCFHVGERPTHFAVRAVHTLDDLAPLSNGRPIQWEEVARCNKWSTFVREHSRPPDGFIDLGEVFRVHRGQVTGANAAWIAGDMARLIPKRFLRPTVTKARELLAAGPELGSTISLKRVVDLPVSLDELTADERRRVQQYLAWAKTLGAEDSYVAQQRRSWWAIELRAPAAALVTYMARRAPAFVLNTVRARHLNIAHGLYPRSPLSEQRLIEITTWLRAHASTTGGRIYAGGLVKFEPKELERLHIPRLEDIHGYLAEEQSATQALVARGTSGRRAKSDECVSE